MLQDKELEIRLQFLDEATDYLNTLDTALLQLSRGIEVEAINAALRSAHSIKGGAGMMGFQILSEMAHRLEDAFKVLKVQRNPQASYLDAALEQLLLAAVDCLRQVIERHRQRQEVDPDWLTQQATPIFEQLYERLGEPDEEDAQSILAPEEGQDVVLLLFQTEVEGCLERLETVLATHNPRLREEVEIMAQELGGLGEMLQLSAFTQLCESISQTLAQTEQPEQIEQIAQQALQAWRQTQFLILSGQQQALPTSIPSAADLPIAEASAPVRQPEVLDQTVLEGEAVAFTDATFADAAFTDTAAFADAAFTSVRPEPVEARPPAFTIPVAEASTEPISANIPASSSTEAANEHLDSTVRVSVKQLNQLSDLFSELIIERNGLDLHLRRLRGLVDSLSQRVKTLETANVQLRDAYDKVSPQSEAGPLSLAQLPASTAEPSHWHNLAPDQTFDALEFDRYSTLHLLSQEMMETIVQVQEVTSDIDLGLDEAEQTTRELNKTSRQLQTRLTQVRMRPLSDITNRFPRALRELSLQYQKPVQLQVQGEQLLIDRGILESLSEPLMHLLRNAFDHGIESPERRRQQGKPEQGTIQIQAIHRQNRTLITVSDDGAGIAIDKIRARARQMGLDEVLLTAASDQELLSLIFEPGFSTRDQVTALSGRGVGMDVVRSRLKQIQGEVSVSTQPGQGTTFTLSMPFTLSVARVLLVESRGLLLAFPTDAIREITVVQPDQILSTAGNQAICWNGEMVQLVCLSQWLHVQRPFQPESLDGQASISVPTVLLLDHGQRVGLQVDRCWGEQEVAIRQVEGGLPLPTGFNSCAILGDGRVVPLVGVNELLRWIASCERSYLDANSEYDLQSPQPTLSAVQSAPARLLTLDSTSANRPNSLSPYSHNRSNNLPTRVLIVDDSINVRRFLALTLERAGYQVAQAKDGQDALDKLAAGLTVQAVICDIEMPRLDGYELLTRLKSTPDWQGIPVAMLTSRSSEKHRRLALKLGATAYFSKPYNEQSLLQALEKMAMA
jgi:two-component system, chemotaxis family, sensor histidine kinase and response regulator PixL